MDTSDSHPYISIVIPNYNLDGYLERTIRSVVDQDYSSREVILVDGNSHDGSHQIIERYRNQLDHVIIEPDDGHADALNKGFAESHGEIMGWINSDDVLLPGCLNNVAEIFDAHPEVDWIVGNSTHISDQDHLLSSFPPRPHSRIRFLMGDMRWVQQESTFWRRSLWEAAGSLLDTNMRLAVDFELWVRFFRHARLYGVHAGLGAFRMRSGQRSHSFLDEYMAEVESVLRLERTLVSQEYFQQYIDLLQLPFMMRDKHQADMFGNDVTQDDLQAIFLDRDKLTWTNPNRVQSPEQPAKSVSESPSTIKCSV